MRRIVAIIAAATLAGATLARATPARAYVPEQTPRRDAEARARRALSEPRARGVPAGVVVMRGGHVIAGFNQDRAFTPASMIKLATTTTAMVKFGPAHRFATRALVPRKSGAEPRTLYLVGGGDPTLATEAYRRFRFLPKPTDVIKRAAFASGSPTIEQLVARIARGGVRRVRGDLIADESLFDARRTQDGWLPRYLTNEPDTGLLSALTVNEGRADLKGMLLVPSPPIAAATQLRTALARRGITVTGTVRIGVAPRGSVEVARVESPPLAEIVDFINRYSINYPAELLLKSTGARFGGAGTTAAGVSVVRATLKSLGVPLTGFQMTDGSGLSVLDRLTPRSLATLINAIVTGKGKRWEVLRASLPVAGAPGTLQNRMTKSPTLGNVRGKTGQIRRVRGMAGWVTARDGVPVVYVMVFNGAPSPFALTPALDLFGLLLALFRA